MRRESFAYTMLVAAGVCVVCSLVVSTAAVTLRPIQQRNAQLELERYILVAAGILKPEEEGDIESLFQQIETRWVDLESGEFVAKGDRGAEDRLGDTGAYESSQTQEPARLQEVYLVRREGELQRLILPVRGMGLWSMMYGLIALDRDLNTIESLLFYDHEETPGLGGEVDNPRWRAKWQGKKVYGPDGNVRIEVIRGQVLPSTSDAEYKVDGLAGATFTARGVTNLLHDWLGSQGYGAFLDNLRKKVGS